jgi:Secretion system C-terminal sorting domain
MLQLNLQNNTVLKIEIMNATGQLLYTREGKITGTQRIHFPSSWAAGQYFLRVVSANNVEMKKILVR